MSKMKERAAVLSQTELSDGIFSLWIKTDKIAEEAKPGQFISLYSADESRMLPRPISICEIDKEKQALRYMPQPFRKRDVLIQIYTNHNQYCHRCQIQAIFRRQPLYVYGHGHFSLHIRPNR